MTTLESLWYGNIRPAEQFVEGNTEYKELLRLVANNQEKLEATLSSEQFELFERYYNAVNEMNSVSEVEAFKFGVTLAIKLFSK